PAAAMRQPEPVHSIPWPPLLLVFAAARRKLNRRTNRSPALLAEQARRGWNYSLRRQIRRHHRQLCCWKNYRRPKSWFDRAARRQIFPVEVQRRLECPTARPISIAVVAAMAFGRRN